MKRAKDCINMYVASLKWLRITFKYRKNTFCFFTRWSLIKILTFTLLGFMKFIVSKKNLLNPCAQCWNLIFKFAINYKKAILFYIWVRINKRIGHVDNFNQINLLFILFSHKFLRQAISINIGYDSKFKNLNQSKN